MTEQQQRIVELQRQLKIARGALGRIMSGCRDPEAVADNALTAMWPSDQKQPLQGLVGHERRTR